MNKYFALMTSKRCIILLKMLQLKENFFLVNSKDQGMAYVLFDWVGGPDGKIFGPRSWRTD